MNKLQILTFQMLSGGVGNLRQPLNWQLTLVCKAKVVVIVDADMQASATDCIGAKGQPLTIKELQAMDEKSKVEQTLSMFWMNA